MLLAHFSDVVASSGDFIDFMKFGWGTSVIHPHMDEKIEVLRRAGVEFYFGGTLFEKYLVQNRFEEFRLMCRLLTARRLRSKCPTGFGRLERCPESCREPQELSDDFKVI